MIQAILLVFCTVYLAASVFRRVFLSKLERMQQHEKIVSQDTINMLETGVKSGSFDYRVYLSGAGQIGHKSRFYAVSNDNPENMAASKEEGSTGAIKQTFH